LSEIRDLKENTATMNWGRRGRSIKRKKVYNGDGHISYSLSLFHTHTHTLSPFLSLPHTHTLSFSVTHFFLHHTLISPFLSNTSTHTLSLSKTHTHTRTLTFSQSHTLARTHTHTHTLKISFHSAEHKNESFDWMVMATQQSQRSDEKNRRKLNHISEANFDNR